MHRSPCRSQTVCIPAGSFTSQSSCEKISPMLPCTIRSKKQHVVEVKEVKVRYKIDVHDYEVRLKSVRKFISQGNKVKIVVMLRGREMQHSNLAFELANRFLADLENDPIQVEKKPQLEGRNVTLYLTGQSS